MKKLLTLALALVALAAFTGLGVAQQERPKQNLESLPELESRQAFEPGVKPKCPKPPVQYLGGKVDGFGGGNDSVTTSPELAAFLALHPPARQFDEGGPNKLFGHSFRMRENCKVCAVQFEIKMRAEGDLFTNDKIHIYGKTITPYPPPPPGEIWTAPLGSTGSGAPGTFVLSAFLPPNSIARLNEHIFTNAPGHWLNVVAQDDHAFDYVRLRIWYY